MLLRRYTTDPNSTQHHSSAYSYSSTNTGDLLVTNTNNESLQYNICTNCTIIIGIVDCLLHDADYEQTAITSAARRVLLMCPI